MTADQKKSVVSEAKAELVAYLIAQHKQDFDYISPAQVAGMLDVSLQTLIKLNIPRYVMVVGKVVKYRLSEVRAYLQTTRES